MSNNFNYNFFSKLIVFIIVFFGYFSQAFGKEICVTNFGKVQLQRNVEPSARANAGPMGPLRAVPCYVPFAPLLAGYTSSTPLAQFAGAKDL